MQLNFPSYPFKIKEADGKQLIWDVIRKKWFVLQAEEWVRQHLIHYLIEDLGYPKGLISVEKLVTVNQQRRRYDLAVANKEGGFILLAECKAPTEKINQATFNQVAAYNIQLQVPYLLVTNGLQHFFCKINFETKNFEFLKEVPKWGDLTV